MTNDFWVKLCVSSGLLSTWIQKTQVNTDTLVVQTAQLHAVCTYVTFLCRYLVSLQASSLGHSCQRLWNLNIYIENVEVKC